MKAERWKQVNDLFQSAVERAPGERAGFLDETCNSDEELRREVESLLTSHEQATNFIELPAFEVAPELVTNDIAAHWLEKLLVITASSHSSASAGWARFISRAT